MILTLRGRGAYSAAVSYTQAAGVYDLVFDPSNPADSYVFVGSTATTGAALTDRRYWLPYGAAGTEAYEAIEQRFARGAEDTLPDRLDGMDDVDTGAAEDLSGIDGRVEDLEVLTTQGDLVYHNGTGPARLPKGTTGQALHMSGNNPAWATPLLTLMNVKGAAAAIPSTGTHEATDTYFHSDVAAGEYAFWRCTQKGTCGTLNSGSTTGTTFAGSPNVVVNAITGLTVGNYIAIAGVTGILKVVDLPGAVAATTTDAEAAAAQKVIPVTATTGFAAGDVIVLDAAGTPEFATVASVEADVSLTVAENLTATHANGVTVANCIVVDTNADAAVSAAAVTYSAPVFKGFGVMEGA